MDKDKLIDLVFNVPAIWNKRHKQHHNRYTLAREWRKVATRIGVTENDARSCWKNLRQEFGKQLQKSQAQSGDTASDEYETHWPYFNKLYFLHDQFTPRHISSSSVDQPSESLTQDTLDPKLEVSYESDRDHSTPSSLPNVCSPLYGSQSEDPIQTSTPSVSDSKYSVTQMDPNDEDVGFFNSLLPHVRKLTPRDKLKFRMKTQETLFDLLFPSDSPTPKEMTHQTQFNFPSTSTTKFES